MNAFVQSINILESLSFQIIRKKVVKSIHKSPQCHTNLHTIQKSLIMPK